MSYAEERIVKHVKWSVVVACAAFCGHGVAFGAVIDSGAGAGADAYVQLNSTSNFGSGDVVVKWDGGNTGTTNRKGYIRFDLSTLSEPVTSAALELRVALNNGGGTPQDTNPQTYTLAIYGLNDGATAGGGFLGEDWGETAINWNNAPANIVSGTGAGNAVRTGTGTADGGQATLLGSFTILNSPVGTEVVALSGTNLVNFLNADTNGLATFIVTRTGFTANPDSDPLTPTPTQGSANLSFSSGENATVGFRPQLYINEPIPEPATAAIIVPAAALLARRRTRRAK
jgi:hypothetical protein